MTTPTKPNPLDEAGQTPTLDYFYGKEPDELTDEEIVQLIAAHRAERESYLEKERERENKDKKEKRKKVAASKRTPKAAETEASNEETPGEDSST